MRAMQDDLKGADTGQRLSENAAKASMSAAIWASTALIDIPIDGSAPLAPPPYTPLPPTDAPGNLGPRTTLSFRQRLLSSLRLGSDGMNNRAEQIKPAFQETFKWLFDNDCNDVQDGKKKPQVSFRRWLSSGDQRVFWITGLPASGKSTLMKFITTHPSLHQRLQEWSGGDEVHVIKFYFWNPGSKAQKSRIGLLQSLLHQLLCLGRNLELSDAVAPRRRLFFDLAGDQAEAPDWEWAELRKCLFRLASELKGRKIRLALFVDGLDEYEDFAQERPETHDLTNEIVEFFMDLNSNFGAKLCVSSRPYPLFGDRCPCLRMQELTQPDIDLYIDRRLLSSPAIQKAREIEPEVIDKLIVDMGTKARGVFLWVVLVVEQLLRTAIDNPHTSAILSVFDSLPEDLNKLYDTIQNQIGPVNQHHASKLYQLTMEWKRIWNSQMEAIFLWLADEEDPTMAGFPGLTKPFPVPERHEAVEEQTVRLVEGCTRGILQVSDGASSRGQQRTIDFLHKTTYDWLREPSNWERILANGPPGYEPILPILAVLVSHARSLARDGKYAAIKQCTSRIFMLAGEVRDSPESRAKLVAILDQLDPHDLRELRAESILLQTAVSAERRTCELSTMTWAAAWACHPYIRGKLEQDASLELTRAGRGFSFLRKGVPPQISVLEIAVLGFRLKGSSFALRENPWYHRARTLDAWHAWQRLETIKLLLEKGGKMEGYMTVALQAVLRDAPKDSAEAEYARLLTRLAGWKILLGHPNKFDDMRSKSFPEDKVQEAHEERLFPGHKIS